MDDLTAREVLIHAGIVLVDTFRADLLDGTGVDRARELVPPAFTQATEFRGIFELFEDDDVLDLFEMSEPSDAAVAGGDPVKREMGVVDQRIEAWFEPFGWTTPTGYIGK